MSAASTRASTVWLRSALRVPKAPLRLRACPSLLPRLATCEGRRLAPAWLRVAAPLHRRPYSITTPPEAPQEQQSSEQQSSEPRPLEEHHLAQPSSEQTPSLEQSLEACEQQPKHQTPDRQPVESQPAEQQPLNPRLSVGQQLPEQQLQEQSSSLETHPEGSPAQDAAQHLIPEDAIGSEAPQSPTRKRLPLQCPGCGAFSHTTDKTIPGFFDLERKAVKSYLNPPKRRGIDNQTQRENQVVQELMATLSPEEIEQFGLSGGLVVEEAPSKELPTPKRPLCDRCHDILHHNKGVSIYHPSVESIRRTIAESPHNDNHIYHILDASDFPMSVVPRLNDVLGGVALRTRNRRSRSDRFLHGQRVQMSFVITKSDVLAPTKQQVDRLLPYLRETLRQALGRSGKDIRLGNVILVSAKRSWWTRELKDKIWDRGGAAWMVGKVNVGKSQLFEAIFPKGRVGEKALKSPVEVGVYKREGVDGAAEEPKTDEKAASAEAEEEQDDIETDDIDLESLLPPARKLTNYPTMPTVSALPGTTASPIRIPFGNNKGELIDLPGLARSDLELYVKEEDRHSLVMDSRIVPVQQSILPGQSLLLGGGLIRITPTTPDLVFLSYAFTPIPTHVTSTAKAEGLQLQTVPTSIPQMMNKQGAECVKSAGKFLLKDDVTKSRSGPITRNDFLKMKVRNLPWRVLATDILIEGVGWVEIVAQVRAKALFKPKESASADDPWARILESTEGEEEDDDEEDKRWSRKRRRNTAHDEELGAGDEEQQLPEQDLNWPEIEVFSPEGRFVDSRPCLNGWMLNKPLVKPKHKQARPRKSMKGQKKLERERARATYADARASVRVEE